MALINIIEENDEAIFEAEVTIRESDTGNLERAANYLASYAAEHNQRTAVTYSEVAYRTGLDVTIRFFG